MRLRRPARIRRSAATDLAPTMIQSFSGMYDASARIASGSLIAADAVVIGCRRARAEHRRRAASRDARAMPRDSAFSTTRCWGSDGSWRTARSGSLMSISTCTTATASRRASTTTPRVLTISLHQDPRTLFPGTGMPSELGRGEGWGPRSTSHCRQVLTIRVGCGRFMRSCPLQCGRLPRMSS